MNSTTRNCWNTGKCDSPLEQCFVHFKTAAAGQALCRETCPKDWLCETRVPDGSGAACGPSPMIELKQLTPTSEMRALLASTPWGDSIALCDRANPPRGTAHFEITCFDGGQTGNRYTMVKTLLYRAACCGGVALLPPEFDHFQQSGASCFDFRGLLRHALPPPPSTLPSDPSSTAASVADAASVAAGWDLKLAPHSSRACALNVSTNSKRWWGPLQRETAAHLSLIHI